MKNRFTQRIGLAAGLVGLLWLAGAAGVQAQTGNEIVGSWHVKVLPAGGGAISNVAAINSDGTVTNSDPLFGVGIGGWEKTGNREYVIKFSTFTSSDAGLPPGTAELIVRGVVKVRKSGSRASGPFVTSFLKANGDELGSFPGVVKLKKFAVD